MQATIECGFILKRVRDMIRTYSQKFYELSYIVFLWKRKCQLNQRALYNGPFS